MIYTINSLREALFQDINGVYEIFKNFFGEEYVDLQLESPISLEHLITDNEDISDVRLEALKDRLNGHKPFIMVYWPTVTVTNENDKSVDIQELYAKIPVSAKGEVPLTSEGFYLNRSRYSKKQFLSNYMHSHIQTIPKGHYTDFQTPCLGSGPIKGTIVSLKTANNAATWLLFCQELSLYVTVESLRGVPWKKLEQIGYSSSQYSYARTHATWNDFYHDYGNMLKDFVPYYLKHGKFIFDYKYGTYNLGTTMFNTIIDMSNCFIEFYNSSSYRNKETTEQMFKEGTLREVLVKGEVFYALNASLNPQHLIDGGAFICNFKESPVYLTIDEDTEEPNLQTIILDYRIVNCILDNILNVINYRYGDTNTESSSISENVLYL